MSEELYQVIALVMRYWFAFLGVVIAVFAWLWLLGERSKHRRRLHDLPDAGTIGDLLVLEGSEELEPGTSIPLPYEGVLGSLRTCDIVIPCGGVAPEHLTVSFQPQKGVSIRLLRGRTCLVDGEELTERRALLQHGSILTVGEAKLRVRFFRGIDAPVHPQLMEDDAPNDPPEESEDQTSVGNEGQPDEEKPDGGSLPNKKPFILRRRRPDYEERS